jgi:lysophospholipase L1-like esterase
MKNSLLLFFTGILFAFGMAPAKKIKIFLAGDSTIAIKDIKAYPETGWGMPFVQFWDSTVMVVNKAKNGRSTSYFKQEGLWKSITDEANEGDYIFIQFGHNDEVSTKKTYTTEKEFEANLVQYVKESRDKKATPVLLTPVARRKFDSTGHILGTHDVYAQIVRNVAKKENVPMIDLDKKAQQLYQDLGVEASKLLFNYLEPGQHPNYPDGKKDDTHFSELGARLIAQLVLKEIRGLNLELSRRIIVREQKK